MNELVVITDSDLPEDDGMDEILELSGLRVRRASARTEDDVIAAADGFIGDGSIRTGVERALDLFYSVNLGKSLWLSGDYQHIVNPAFNADRGPVNIFSARVHVEF